jgi:hypothetical protein
MSKHAKGTPPVKESDFFSRLEPVEHRTCRDYLLSQEIVRQEKIAKLDSETKLYIETVPGLAGVGELKAVVRVPRPEDWLETRVTMIREAWHLGENFTTQIPENPMWFTHPAARIVVLWPEWPKKPYFEIPCDERLRRIEAFQGLMKRIGSRLWRIYLIRTTLPPGKRQ